MRNIITTSFDIVRVEWNYHEAGDVPSATTLQQAFGMSWSKEVSRMLETRPKQERVKVWQ